MQNFVWLVLFATTRSRKAVSESNSLFGLPEATRGDQYMVGRADGQQPTAAAWMDGWMADQDRQSERQRTIV